VHTQISRKFRTVWPAGLVNVRIMLDQTFVTGTSTAQPLGIAAVLVHGTNGTTLLGDVLLHLLEIALRHGYNVIVTARFQRSATIIFEGLQNRAVSD